MTTSRAARPTLLVLPFASLGGGPEQASSNPAGSDQAVLADGMTEDLIGTLSRTGGFLVIARSTAFALKDRGDELPGLLREMGVRHVLEGSVRRAGNRIRITARLEDRETGHQIWAERYDRELDDLFALQDEITATVAASIEPALSTALRQRTRGQAPEDFTVWELHQQGIWHLHRFTAADHAEAEGYLRRAAERDPGFARAVSGLAYARILDFVMGYGGYGADSEGSLARAIETAQLAVALDAEDALAHFVLGHAHSWQGEHEAALADLERALAINPNLPMARNILAWELIMSGRPAEAGPQSDMAIRLSPYDPLMWVFLQVKAFGLAMAGEAAEAVEWGRRAVAAPNAQIWAYVSLACALAMNGEPAEAGRVIERMLAMRPDFSRALLLRNYQFRYDADRDRFLDSLGRAGLWNRLGEQDGGD